MEHLSGTSLGAALIVRDAESCIGYAIESLSKVCRQIVVVDTGSVDFTPAVCSRCGAEVHYYQWNDNFSDARNYSLGLIRTEWVIILDADEILDVFSFKQHAHLMNDPQAGGIRIKIDNHLGHGELAPKSSHRYTRLFRNDKRFRFTGRIHEQIAPPIEASGYKILDSEIIIRHYGYITTDPGKLTRNIDLLKAEIKDNPHDAWLVYHLAESEFAAGNADEASRLFKSVDNSPELSIEQIESVFLRLAQISIGREDFEDAEKRLDFISSDPNREGFRMFLKGASYLVQKQFSKAFDCYTSPIVAESALVDKEQVHKALDLLEIVLAGKKVTTR